MGLLNDGHMLNVVLINHLAESFSQLSHYFPEHFFCIEANAIIVGLLNFLRRPGLVFASSEICYGFLFGVRRESGLMDFSFRLFDALDSMYARRVKLMELKVVNVTFKLNISA